MIEINQATENELKKVAMLKGLTVNMLLIEMLLELRADIQDASDLELSIKEFQQEGVSARRSFSKKEFQQVGGSTITLEQLQKENDL